MVVYLNTQSCRNEASDLSDLVTDIDIQLLTEKQLKVQGDEAQKAEMTPAGYILKSFPRKGRRGDGLAFLVKKSLEIHSCKTAILFDF